eukprot:283437_1
MFQDLKTWQCQLAAGDEKKEIGEDDCEQEAVVHADGDHRQAIYESNHKQESIIQCIGQLRCEFYYENHNYKKHKPGTGTAFDIDPVTKTVFVITCAHNVRHRVAECSLCHNWMELDAINCSNPNCIGGSLRGVMIQANKIQFKRRSIKKYEYEEEINGQREKFKFGDTIMTYNSDCEVVYDELYAIYFKPQEGYDFAIISFVIDDYDMYSYNHYLQHTKNVKIQNGESLKEFKTFQIFGYPDDKKEEMKNDVVYKMFGQQSSSSHNYEVKRNKNTNKLYLKQREVDTFTGQSGSAVWIKNKNEKVAVIVGVHVGGSPVKKFNLATLISPTDLHHISACRQPLYDAIQCMGRLRVQYCYYKEEFSVDTVCFGTVYAVNSQKALVMTTAGNCSLKGLKCSSCGKLEIKKGKKQMCSKCGNVEMEKQLIKPTRVTFIRKAIYDDEKQQFKFGDTISQFLAQIEYIPDEWTTVPHVKSGHNIAILSFNINDEAALIHYVQHTKNIRVQHGVATLKKFTRLNTLYGFVLGFRYQKYGTRVLDLGWNCSSTNKYAIETYEKTNNKYLEQFRKGDLGKFKGSAGSIFFVKDNKSNLTIIVGVHSGTEIKTKRAIGTLISHQHLSYILSSYDGTDKKRPNFSGIWILKANENQDTFMKSQGSGYLKRKLMSMTSMTLTLQHNRDTLKVHTKYPFIGEINEEISLNGTGKETTNEDGHKTKTIAEWHDDESKSGTLIITTYNLTTNNTSTVEMVLIDDNTLKDTINNHKGASMTRTFQRQQKLMTVGMLFYYVTFCKGLLKKFTI